VQHIHDKFVIFSDSLSVSISIKNKKADNILIRELLLRFHDILKTKSVKLYWIPIHVVIRGNEKVDALAKQSLRFQKTDLLLSACDSKPDINKLVSSKWKANWGNAVFNNLHDINPSLDVSPSLSLSNRHDQTVLRCRIGHTIITHSYLLTNDNAPFCVACNENFTVNIFFLSVMIFHRSTMDFIM
jgi:hypothetical protein